VTRNLDIRPKLLLQDLVARRLDLIGVGHRCRFCGLRRSDK
jgi:hypothetical protein